MELEQKGRMMALEWRVLRWGVSGRRAGSMNRVLL